MFPAVTAHLWEVVLADEREGLTELRPDERRGGEHQSWELCLDLSLQSRPSHARPDSLAARQPCSTLLIHVRNNLAALSAR